MATKTAVMIAPGWWADPLLRHELRYHNGTAWTNHVLDKGVPDIDPLPVGIKLVAPDPERQPFEPPGFAGVPADVLRKRRRRRARLRSSLWMVGGLVVVLALIVSLFEFFGDRIDFGDDPVPITVPAVSTPLSSAPPTTVPTTAPATAPLTAPASVPAAGTAVPSPTAAPGTAVVVVTAAP